MLVVFFAKEGACPLKAAFFPTAFQTACLLLPLQKKHVSLEGVTRRRLSSLSAFKIGDLVALTAKGPRASIKLLKYSILTASSKGQARIPFALACF